MDQFGPSDQANPRIISGGSIELFGSGDELDAEGIAVANGHYYVIGSHALSRKDHLQHNRHHVVRFPTSLCDESHRKPGDGAIVEKTSLNDTIKNQDSLAPFLRRPLTSGGINIEGIAIARGRAYIGFRSPSRDARVAVASLAVEGLFDAHPTNASISWLHLGKDRGIRDLARVSDGLLILTGNASISVDGNRHKRLAATIAHWDLRSQRPVPLATLPTASGKPEALLVLSETDEAYRVLILRDSAASGAPAEYLVAKHRPPALVANRIPRHSRIRKVYGPDHALPVRTLPVLPQSQGRHGFERPPVS